NLLASLGAMRGVSITEHGRAIARLPVHPRLGHMLLECGRDAAELAALLSDRDPLRGVGADLGLRIEAIRKDRVPGAARIRAEAQRLSKLVDKRPGFDLAEAAARAFPDRIALKRTADAPRWLTSGGKGVKLEQTDPLARSRMLVAVDTDGHPKEAQIRQALPIDMETVRRVFRDQIESIDVIEWSKRSGKVVAQSESRLGQLVLHATRLDNPPEEGLARAMMDGVRELGIPSKPESDQLRIRVALMREAGFDLPDMSDEALLADLEGWLLPFIGNTRTATEWRNFDTYSPLKSSLNWDQQQLLDREAPSHFTTPLDRKIAIDYCESDPTISVRLQEMFGVTSHPLVAGRPLRVTLLSPAQRPVQTTMDLPGFWETSYEDVRKDMRGRYPKHPWPDDPTKADPTLRVKRKQ
ncbi:MAG: ATP-dependent helicase HrpB, partial [Boseongicola sp.]|nr:ATP-dependent helicase HrpB [Boseongicola sp.]